MKTQKKVGQVIHSNIGQIILILIFLIPFNFFLYKIFSMRSLSFGCFDDCSNYIGGYFMMHGKTLYSEIFFNHIMGMAWLSFFTQKFHHSINLYDLILFHRKVIMLLSLIFDFLLIKRFKWPAFFFVIFYELSKFYVFGDRFLGESLVVYAVVYLMGLIFEKLQKRKLSTFDYILSGVFTWFIIVMREPYIPLAILVYGVILWGKINRRKIYSVIVFFALIVLVAIHTNLPAFYFNDVTVNLSTAIKTENDSNKLLGVGLIQIFFYPLFILFTGTWNKFHYFLVALDIAFLAGIGYQFIKRKKKLLVLLLFIILGISNIRITSPGTIYFGAYHIMVWYGLFLFLAILLCFELIKNYIKLGLLLFGVIFLGWVLAVFSPGSYLYDKLDLQEQLLTNFGEIMNVGNTVHNLSSSTDTLFLDGADDMIYWESGLYSPYKYSWYTGVMPQIPRYRKSRTFMFRNNPPDFYYDFCSPMAPYHTSLPSSVRPLYQQLYENGKPSCLYVLKTKLPHINSAQWQQAEQGFFELPK